MSNPALRDNPADDSGEYYAHLKARSADVVGTYEAKAPRCAAFFKHAQTVFPGGYTRDAVMRDPFPPVFEQGKGAELTDLDGNRITDFWFNATSLPLGHADDRVLAAVQSQIQKGTAFFGPTESEIALAEVLIDRLPSAERVRFANSGSEAVMMAIRIARAATQRDLIVKFEGSYHGSYDDVQWSVSPPLDKVGEETAPTPVPDTSGLVSPDNRTIVLPYNNAELLETAMAEVGPRVAAVLVEPLANRIGLVMPSAPFLAAARRACEDHESILIFDEVIAFRIGFNGAQGELGVTPDMTTLGKVIGGGFPVGAIVGKADVMSVSAPLAANRMTHAGTFNANPVTMVAGKATLDALQPDTFERLNEMGDWVRKELRRICANAPLSVTGAGSLFKLNATPGPITDYRSAGRSDRKWEQVASLRLLSEGFLLTANLHGCLSLATEESQVERFLTAVDGIVREAA